MSKNNFQERLRKMEDTKQRFLIRKFRCSFGLNWTDYFWHGQ